MFEALEVVGNAKETPGKRARKTKDNAPKEDFSFCLGTDDGKGGIVLSAPVSERDALVQSFKKDVCFFRVQKMKAQLSASDDMKLLAVPAK